MSKVILIEVVNYGQGGEGPFRAGKAIVSIDGLVHSQLRTGESYEITVKEPEISTRSITHPPQRPMKQVRELTLGSRFFDAGQEWEISSIAGPEGIIEARGMQFSNIRTYVHSSQMTEGRFSWHRMVEVVREGSA